MLHKKEIRALRLLVVVAVVFAAVSQFGRNTARGQTPVLRGVYNALSGAMSPIWVAQDAALFAKHGVSVRLDYLAATSAVQSMIGGSDDVGLVGSQGIDSKLEGADMTYIASAIQTFVFHLYGQSEIGSVTDLRGKVLGVTQPASSTDYCARIILSQSGLVPDKDVKILYAGSGPALLAALKAGHAAAGIISAPTTIQAKASGLKPILNITDLKIPFLFVGLLTSSKEIREKSDALSRFLRGYIEAIAVIRKDKETTLRSLAKYLKTDNKEVLESVYEEYRDVFPRVPLVTAAEIKAVLDVEKSPKAKQARPEEFFDNSLVQKIQSSGFIDSLYSKP